MPMTELFNTRESGVKEFMYRRYTVPYLNGNTNLPQGIMGAAFKLTRSEEMELADKELLLEKLQLFQDSLPTPDIFDSDRNKKAICWFKPTAHLFIDAVEEVKLITEKYISPIQLHESENIGEIVYEDEYQVMAIP